MPVSKEKQFSLDCHDTVHVVKFNHVEFLTDLLAVGTRIRLIIVRCTAKVLYCPSSTSKKTKYRGTRQNGERGGSAGRIAIGQF